MLLESTNLVILTLTVFVSGALTKIVVEALSPRSSVEANALVVQLLCYGTVPFAVALALYGQLPAVDGKPPPMEQALADWRYVGIWLAVVIGVPVIQGIVITVAWQVAEWAGVVSVRKMPTAWDRLWVGRAECFVVVTVESEDGLRRVGGEVGEASTAARLENGGDLFIEYEREVLGGHLGERLDPWRGLWLSGDTIREVRLFWTRDDETSSEPEANAINQPTPEDTDEQRKGQRLQGASDTEPTEPGPPPGTAT